MLIPLGIDDPIAIRVEATIAGGPHRARIGKHSQAACGNRFPLGPSGQR